jgi:histidinol dehydrogenase
MKIINWSKCTKSEQKNLLRRISAKEQADVREDVCQIIQNVRKFGDFAVKDYTKQFDGITLPSLNLTAKEWQCAADIDEAAKQAIDIAYKNIKRFHELQLPKTLVSSGEGFYLYRKYNAIEKVGLYVPGGTAPLVSTLLMLAIPASIAGCKTIVVITPPNKLGTVDPVILYAARVCGIENVYKVGGAQGIAALAYGTKTIPKVAKIFGPGNKYVTEAKLQVAQDPYGAAFDMPAGPSEVLVIADAEANPSFVAADLLAQAEHDENAKVILVTTDKDLAAKVLIEVNEQASYLSRQSILKLSIDKGIIAIVKTIEEAFAIANSYAPEHLILQIANPRNYLAMIQNAGSVFVGPWAPEALGDYASGPNHVLPTYGYAASFGGLSVESFMKSTTFQEIQAKGFINLAVAVESLAELEGLDAHKNSVVIRRKCLAGETK